MMLFATGVKFMDDLLTQPNPWVNPNNVHVCDNSNLLESHSELRRAAADLMETGSVIHQIRVEMARQMHGAIVAI